jgi:hypothetical protein
MPLFWVKNLRTQLRCRVFSEDTEKARRTRANDRERGKKHTLFWGNKSQDIAKILKKIRGGIQ